MFRLLRREPVYAMSMSRKDLAADIETNTRTLICHLAKLYYFQEDIDDINHWRSEVYNFFHEIKRLKGSNKFPDEKFIIDNTYTVNKDSIELCMDGTYADYIENHTPTRGYNLRDFQHKVELYYKWLSHMLASNGQVFRKEVYSKLESLGF